MCSLPSFSAEIIKSYSSKITLNSVYSNSLVVDYEAIPNTHPEHNNHWVGIWEGRLLPADLVHNKMMGKKKISKNLSRGRVVFNGLSLGRSLEYTAVYFNGAKLNQAVSVLHFINH